MRERKKYPRLMKSTIFLFLLKPGHSNVFSITLAVKKEFLGALMMFSEIKIKSL